MSSRRKKSTRNFNKSGNDSSDVDELKELEMRTGFVNTKVNPMRMPVLKKPTNRNLLQKRLTNKTLTFADSVVSKENGTKAYGEGGSVYSRDMSLHEDN